MINNDIPYDKTRGKAKHKIVKFIHLFINNFYLKMKFQ